MNRLEISISSEINNIVKIENFIVTTKSLVMGID